VSAPRNKSTDSRLVEVAGSERWPRSADELVGPADVSSELEEGVTVYLREKTPIDEVELYRAAAQLPRERPPVDRDAFLQAHSARDKDLAAATSYFEGAGLRVETDAPRRAIVLHGTVGQFQDAFAVQLQTHRDAGSARHYLGHTGPLRLPAKLAAAVVGVFGLDGRRQARPRLVARRTGATVVSSAELAARCFSATEIASYYRFPAGASGLGQTIAVLEFGGGFLDSDLDAYFEALGMATPRICAVGVAGAQNEPSGPEAGESNGEVALDIEVLGAIAPDATIVVYFAPFTERGWVDAITTAIHSTEHPPDVISISWGFTEGEQIWTTAALEVVNGALKEAAALNVTVLAASGDDGTADEQTDGRLHVDFPASSPFITGVGGTSLRYAAFGGAEVVWNNGPRGDGGGAGGGGVSRFFARPPYQDRVQVPPSPSATGGRGVPDLSANADPNSGYEVFVEGRWVCVGGTSAAAPLWAGLIVRLNERLGSNIGFLNPLLYEHLGPTQALRDVTVGTNDQSGRGGPYHAHIGWDAASGWGTPDGERLLNALLTPAQEHLEQALPAATSLAAPMLTPRLTSLPTWGGPLGAAIDIAAAPIATDGPLWAVSCIPFGYGYSVHRWIGDGWGPAEASGVRVSAGGSGGEPVVVDSANRGWWLKDGDRRLLPGSVVDVAYSAGGHLWALGSAAPWPQKVENELLEWVDGGWQQCGRIGSRVAVTPDGEPVVLSDTGIACRAGGQWHELPGTGVDIEVAPDGTLYVIGRDSRVYAWDGQTWCPIGPAGVSLAVAADGALWLVAIDGGVYRHEVTI
jgi:kumamolisin